MICCWMDRQEQHHQCNDVSGKRTWSARANLVLATHLFLGSLPDAKLGTDVARPSQRTNSLEDQVVFILLT